MCARLAISISNSCAAWAENDVKGLRKHSGGKLSASSSSLAATSAADIRVSLAPSKSAGAQSSSNACKRNCASTCANISCVSQQGWFGPRFATPS
eukprot:CAMPEP_0177413830 /NCGR_PEP_ID=MMETSP0368-20130122/66734_1 /TAXON_ID=447022 ORGANISM="Scrippsiella hangoei-like, Strain SHHI-4" /NCGR_SAMPLE_ID=MMETSP0368 /ASSEMBLY_ACC=CAM_ASM_000363 /LENGTH=94 /DNA_ID=CAMNT_0018883187 /DNA_START=633 /DNA_END=914 /DNA_ORIENTATION=+